MVCVCVCVFSFIGPIYILGEIICSLLKHHINVQTFFFFSVVKDFLNKIQGTP